MTRIYGVLLGSVICLTLTARAQDTQPADTQPTTQSQPATQPDAQPASRPAARTRPASRPTTSETSPAHSQPASKPTTTAASTSTSAPAPKDRFLAVLNGRIHTVTGPVLERATILAKNGVITALGQDVQLPTDAEVVDAAGLDVYPGLIAAVASGLHGPGEPQDTTNVFSLNTVIGLAGGITTALAGPHAAKLTYGTTEGILLKSNLYFDLPYSTHTPLERAKTRADLERVRTYLRDLARYEREKAVNKDAKAPDKEWLKERYETFRKLLAHELIAVVSANSASELRGLAELAEQYDFELVVRGATEGWIVAPLLGRAHLKAVLTPRDDQAPDERSNRPSGSTIENAARLREHGVPVAVVPPTPSISLSGLAGRDLLQLNMEAGFTVRGGLSNDDALRTITIDAARVLGVDDRVGSLEVGKDADIVVADGDLLHYMTQVRYTIVNGRVAYDKSKQPYYKHIRPTGQREANDFPDDWPRRLEWPAE
jgi:imidazolonepropionase-like amidohydrolase